VAIILCYPTEFSSFRANYIKEGFSVVGILALIHPKNLSSCAQI